jgi:hypothetical protein
MGQTPRNLNMVAHPPIRFALGPSLSLWERSQRFSTILPKCSPAFMARKADCASSRR